jgi:hypothetical protein
MRPEPVTQEEMQILFRQEYERMLENAYHESQMDEDAEGFIGDEMPKEDLGEDDEEDCFDFSLRRSSEYHPYPSKTVRAQNFAWYLTHESRISRQCCSTLWITFRDVASRVPKCRS